MNNRIALDLDGVIADIGAALDAQLEKKGHIDYDYSGWLTKVHTCELSDEIMDTPIFWKNLIPFVDAWHQVNTWFSRGYDIYIVTARRSSWSQKITQQWLDEWRLCTMTPIFCNMGEKHNVIKDIDPLFMVEDNHNEVETLIQEGVNAYLRRAWYNKEYWDVLPSINTLFDIDIESFKKEA
jgi:5'(3')-deoxyribonucleotidase